MKKRKSLFVILFIYICIILFVLWIFWPVRNDNYKEITYQELPSDIRKKFKEIYNYKEPPKVSETGDISWYSPPFSECYNMNTDCPCNIRSGGGIIRNPYFVLTSCGKKKKMTWGILERVFIIKNDSVYYPWNRSAGTETGEARSFLVKIDTLKFRIEKMK
ncbi:MAG: hypothetical protein LBQ34_03500 [Alphaproteobacteria bacterium]|jgi:hypothetical protein|nr:hypothetical protein [Alphaproteobacteria bacterium]